MINDLSNLAVHEKDHASHDFLEWFVKEQVEEESVARTIVDQLKLIGDNGTGLYMIDQQLGQRTGAASPAQAYCVKNKTQYATRNTHNEMGVYA